MGTITWIEDAPKYIKSIIDELEDNGHMVRIIRDANTVMKQLRQVAKDSEVVILDLWLPTGSGQRVPEELDDTQRGIWLYQQIASAMSKRRDKKIVVLSGNVDIDTIEMLMDALLVKPEYIWKKPAEFRSFVSFIEELAQVNDQAHGMSR